MLASDVTVELVVRAQRGDASAFGVLARHFLRAAYSVSLAVVGRTADAEDVAQDSLVVALERIETCREPARFAGWLLQIVRNRSRNLLESRRLRDVSGQEPPEWSSGPAPDGLELREQLLGALNRLDEQQREVVLLHDLEQWTHAEIASALRISELMSRQQLFQARKKLRAALGDEPAREVNDAR